MKCGKNWWVDPEHMFTLDYSVVYDFAGKEVWC